ncbi:MAG: acyl-CoA/acyl-ACP dehydrogenase [Deltaproteobacteria bacterium]|nr:acyl-CoA/acyl-ACP dehydrogenase [Deltaproteobacteria bacterium]
MKFDLSEDQALLRQSTRDFLTSECPLERSRKVMEDNPDGYESSEWQRLAEMGYLGLMLPPSVGGQGLGAIELAIVLEEVGRACMPGPYLDAVLTGAVLNAAGGQEALLADISSGKKLVTIARDDAAFAGNPGRPARCEAGRVRGTKYFVPFAAQADALLVTTPAVIWLVQRPFTVAPLPTIDLAQRFGKVTLDHAAEKIGAASLLDRADQLAAIGASATLLGIMSRALEITIDYVQTRRTFNRPIGSFQALQHRLSEMLLRTESTRSAAYRAAWCFDTGDADTALACASAKAYAGDASRLVCGEAIQMHGGIGFTWELDLHFYFKRAKTLEQHYGSTEVQLEHALAAAGF